MPLENSGKAALALRPVSQETCRPRGSNETAEGAVGEIPMAILSHRNPPAANEAALAEARAKTLQAAILAAILGATLIFIAGFAQPQTIHNGAHDTRHGLSFPCH